MIKSGIEPNQILTAISLFSFSQEKTTVKGKITDENQVPLAGVHIFMNEIEIKAQKFLKNL
jgi:hypothetical protein